MSSTPPSDQLLDEAREETLHRLTESRLRDLLRLSQAFNATLELDDLLPTILRLAVSTAGAEAGSIWLTEGGNLVCRAAQGPVEALVGVELPIGAGIVGDAVLRKQPVMANDAASNPNFLPQIDEATGYTTRCLLAVPMIARGEAVGAIEVINDESGAFDQEDLDFLAALVDDAAAAVRNARLFEAEKRARDLKALLEISHEITSTFDTDRVVLSLVNLAGRAIRFDRCVLALADGDELRVRAISGEAEVERKSAAVRELESFLRWVADREEPVRIEDVADAEDREAARIVERFASYLETNSVTGLLVLPVRDAEGSLGLLLFEFSRPRAFGQWEAEAAQLLADQAALALRNAQLYADVPFISWLEPLREKRRVLAALPAATWIRYAVIAAAVTGILTFVRLPYPVWPEEASVRSAVQRAARSDVSGVIESVHVREGERVDAGAVLATLRDDNLLLELTSARGDLAVAARQALSEEARGEVAAAAIARARAAELEQAVALLEERLAGAVVRAPTGGRVLTSRPEELVGSRAAAGTPVLWLGDPDWIELELLVPQVNVAMVLPGDRVRARVNAYPGVTFSGRVASVAPAAQPGPGNPTFAVRAVLDNRDGMLLPGMTANARVSTRSRALGTVLFRRPARWLRMTFWW
jgi:GAF domain-containing protein/multidrug resistance efflux pump